MRLCPTRTQGEQGVNRRQGLGRQRRKPGNDEGRQGTTRCYGRARNRSSPGALRRKQPRAPLELGCLPSGALRQHISVKPPTRWSFVPAALRELIRLLTDSLRLARFPTWGPCALGPLPRLSELPRSEFTKLSPMYSEGATIRHCQ